MSKTEPSPAGKLAFIVILLVATLGLGVYTLYSAFTALSSTVEGGTAAPPAVPPAPAKP